MSVSLEDRKANGVRATAVILIAALLLSACTTSARRPSNPSAEQSGLYDYADAFPEEGAVLGLAAGALLGCVVGALASSNKGAGCATGAAAGAAGGALLGAGGGYLIAANQRDYASEEQRLMAMSEAADTELEKARKARKDAESIVADHRQTIVRLGEGYKTRQVSERQLEQAVDEARYDRSQIVRAIDGIEKQLETMDENIQEASDRNNPSYKDLLQQRNALLTERNILNQQMTALEIEIERAEGLLS